MAKPALPEDNSVIKEVLLFIAVVATVIVLS